MRIADAPSPTRSALPAEPWGSDDRVHVPTYSIAYQAFLAPGRTVSVTG
jgi:hypothetical protein